MNKIETNREYRKSLMRLEEIFQAEQNTPEGQEAIELEKQVWDYEKENFDLQTIDFVNSEYEIVKPQVPLLICDPLENRKVPLPTEEDWEDLMIGDSVKVSAGREVFWVEIDLFKGNKALGRIITDLVRKSVHGLEKGDIIEVTMVNVLSISQI